MRYVRERGLSPCSSVFFFFVFFLVFCIVEIGISLRAGTKGNPYLPHLALYVKKNMTNEKLNLEM